MLAVLGKDP